MGPELEGAQDSKGAQASIFALSSSADPSLADRRCLLSAAAYFNRGMAAETASDAKREEDFSDDGSEEENAGELLSAALVRAASAQAAMQPNFPQ